MMSKIFWKLAHLLLNGEAIWQAVTPELRDSCRLMWQVSCLLFTPQFKVVGQHRRRPVLNSNKKPRPVDNLIKHSTIVIYASSVTLTII